MMFIYRFNGKMNYIHTEKEHKGTVEGIGFEYDPKSDIAHITVKLKYQKFKIIAQKAEKLKGKPSVQRFKGLGEMNPLQLRESTVDPDTRRLVQLTVESHTATTKIMDMLLGKKRASDHKAWLEDKGDLATI